MKVFVDSGVNRLVVRVEWRHRLGVRTKRIKLEGQVVVARVRDT